MRGRREAGRPIPPVRVFLRNARLLGQSALGHLVDDPALLAIQVSRRLPLGLRGRVGRLLQDAGRSAPRGRGVAALGAFMAGRPSAAVAMLEAADVRDGGPLAAEVAVLLDRDDLIPDGARPAARARAAWSAGRLGEAVRILEGAGRGRSAQARRLRSELDLMTAGVDAVAAPDIGELGSSAASGPRGLSVLHLITNSLPHTQSGYSLRTHNILTHLQRHGVRSIALTRTGYPVMVGKVLAADEDVIDGVRYVRTLPPSLAATPAQRLEQEVEAALRLVREIRPDVLHATTDFRNALVARAVSGVTGIPWVFEVRGLMEQTWTASRTTPAARQNAAASEKVRRVAAREGELARQAGAVVTLSRTMGEVLEQRGVDPYRITLVPNGVDEALLALDLTPSAARREVGLELPEDAYVVGAVSALVEYEGFEVLLRAAAEIIHSGAGALAERLQVVLVGDGVSAPALQQLASVLGIAGRVRLPGRVPREQARYWVQALDLVVVPRLDVDVARTVTPQKPIEALALGRPVVISDLPALREAVIGDDGAVHGKVFPAGDHQQLARVISACVQDPMRGAELARRGREMAAARTWPALMARYEQVYRRLSDDRPIP